MESYAYIKLLHILSATLLFGTGLGTAFYMWRADLTNDTHIIASVARNVVMADLIFTMPAVIVQPVTGFYMLQLIGLPLTTPWVLISLILYVFIGCCWLPVVWIQMRVAKLAAADDGGKNASYRDFRRYMRWWYSLGWPAFISVVAIFYLMVVKPSIW